MGLDGITWRGEGPVADRIVSVVPSDTYSLVALGARSRLVGRTRFCVEPPGLKAIPTVGGTKKLDVKAIVEMKPDLVVANQEENARDDILRLKDAGLRVWLSFPRTIAQGLAAFEGLAQVVGCAGTAEGGKWIARARHLLRPDASSAAPQNHELRPRCFVPIWRKPWMSVNGNTFIGDVIRVLGMHNVCEDWPSEEPATGRDTRYPVLDVDQIITNQPDVVLLPDEPYPFSETHAAFFRDLPIPASRNGRVLCVSGKDLCWHGAWSIEGIPRLRNVLASSSAM